MSAAALSAYSPSGGGRVSASRIASAISSGRNVRTFASTAFHSSESGCADMVYSRITILGEQRALPNAALRPVLLQPNCLRQQGIFCPVARQQNTLARALLAASPAPWQIPFRCLAVRVPPPRPDGLRRHRCAAAFSVASRAAAAVARVRRASAESRSQAVEEKAEGDQASGESPVARQVCGGKARVTSVRIAEIIRTRSGYLMPRANRARYGARGAAPDPREGDTRFAPPRKTGAPLTPPGRSEEFP